MATRGPRTPIERAQDAARRAATTFEDLPSSTPSELYLRPIATLLRFWFGSASERREAAAEEAYRGLVDGLRRSWNHGEEVLARDETNAELLSELKDLLIEVLRRSGAYVEAAHDSAAATDDGLAFVAKADEILSQAMYGTRQGLTTYRMQLKRAAVEHV